MTDEISNSGRGSPLKAMVSFFTIWQQDITQEDMDAMEKGFWMAPLAGLFFSIIIIVEVAVLALLFREIGFGSDMVTAALVLATVYFGSRFIHFDGLTDFGDGIIVSGTKEDHVRALKDTLVGAGGLGVALIAVILAFSIYSYAGYALLFLGAMTEVMVKNAMVTAAAFGTPGNGMAGRQVGLTTTGSAVRSSILALVLGIVVGVLGTAILNLIFGMPIERDMINVVFYSVIATAVSVLVGYLMARKANSVFGMVNGDILGATNEISRIFVMLVLMVFAVAW